MTDGLKNELLARYSGHGLNNEPLAGIWIANKWKLVIQIFVIQIPTVQIVLSMKDVKVKTKGLSDFNDDKNPCTVKCPWI